MLLLSHHTSNLVPVFEVSGDWVLFSAISYMFSTIFLILMAGLVLTGEIPFFIRYNGEAEYTGLPR